MPRFFQLLLIILTAPLWVPLLLILALLVRSKLGSPILFRQQRAGKGGHPFILLKFRTMLPGNAPDSERLTPFGRFLRSTSLDELPELLNIINGDMALIGPRPLHMRYLPRYTPEQNRRHLIRPGLTGWAQINGRNTLTWEEKFTLDCWYVDHRTLRLDLLILFKTLTQIFTRRGITAPGEATMPEFLGTENKSSQDGFPKV